MRDCPNCDNPTERSKERYILTGKVNTPVYICEKCKCWFIECDLSGTIWGNRTVLIEGNRALDNAR